MVILKEAQQLRGIERLSLYTQKPSPRPSSSSATRRRTWTSARPSTRGVRPTARCSNRSVRATTRSPRGSSDSSPGKGWPSTRSAVDADRHWHRHFEISNELGKLVVSLPEGTKRITDADIEANIGISKDFNNFELCKAVATRDMARALMIADHFARNPKDNPLLLTIMALFGQFRDLFVVNYLAGSRAARAPLPPGPRSSCESCARTTRSCSGRSSRTRPAGTTARYSTSWDCCANDDAKSKGLNSGGASDGELLRELLLKIFLQ